MSATPKAAAKKHTGKRKRKEKQEPTMTENGRIFIRNLDGEVIELDDDGMEKWSDDSDDDEDMKDFVDPEEDEDAIKERERRQRRKNKAAATAMDLLDKSPLVDLDPVNVVSGKRTRKPVTRYVDSKEFQEQYYKVVIKPTEEEDEEMEDVEENDDGKIEDASPSVEGVMAPDQKDLDYSQPPIAENEDEETDDEESESEEEDDEDEEYEEDDDDEEEEEEEDDDSQGDDEDQGPPNAKSDSQSDDEDDDQTQSP